MILKYAKSNLIILNLDNVKNVNITIEKQGAYEILENHENAVFKIIDKFTYKTSDNKIETIQLSNAVLHVYDNEVDIIE